MTTLTSTGAVNLTSSTNWSPAQVPVNGDDLIIGAHTLTLDDDLVLNTITLNHASARFAISGTSRSVEATNGFILVGTIGAVLISTVLTTGMSVTLTGTWSSVSPSGQFSSGIATSTGGNLTLQTVGADQSAVLFADPLPVGGNRAIVASWIAGTLTTVGRFDMPSWSGAQAIVSMTGGTWSHQSTGVNSFGTGTHRVCSLSGTATVNWTGSVDSQSTASSGGVFVLSSSSTSHTIGQTGDTFCLRNASATNLTTIVYVTAGAVAVTGHMSARNGGYCIYSGGGVTNYTNQTLALPSTDYFTAFCYAGTLNVSGLQITSNKGIQFHCYAAAVVTVDANTLFTCFSDAAFFGCYYNTGLESKFVILESDPPTLPSVSDVAAGEVYGYDASPLTGTGLILDPAVLASAMTTSFSSLPEVMTKTTIATLTSQTEFTLTAGSADNDVYNGLMAIITDQSTSIQKAVISISDYVGSTKTVTLSATPGFTITTGDLVTVIAGASGGGGGETKEDIYTYFTTGDREDAFKATGFATEAQINSLQVNTRASVQVPVEIETPDSGTQIWKIRLFLFDIEGNMEAPDSTPTLALVNAAGTDRSSRLSSATTISTGAYSWDYTATDDDDEEQLNWTFTVVEGGLTRIYPATSYVVEETAYRFTSSDRSTLNSRASQTSVDDIPTNAELATALSGKATTSDVTTVGTAVAAVSTKLGTPAGASVSVDIANVKTDTGTTIPNQITGLNNLSASQVNAEVLDVLNVDTFGELSSPPAATSSLRAKLTWIFMWMRNKSTETATERKLYADDTTTVVSTEVVSDDNTTFTKGEAS